MSQFKVTSSVLKSQSSELSDLNGRFKSAVEQLVTAEANLNSMWDGEANDAFHNAFMVDRGKMNEFYNLISQYVEKLNTIATRYEQTEKTNTDIASSRTY